METLVSMIGCVSFSSFEENAWNGQMKRKKWKRKLTHNRTTSGHYHYSCHSDNKRRFFRRPERFQLPLKMTNIYLTEQLKYATIQWYFWPFNVTIRSIFELKYPHIRTFVGKLFGVRVSAFWSHTFCCRSVAEGERENSRRMSSAEFNKLCKTSHDDHIS